MARETKIKSVGEATSADPGASRLGVALRELRLSRSLTLADVAELTGLSVSALSKVENGQMSLTYDKLALLSTGMQVDITYFFSSQNKDVAEERAVVTARRSISRRGQGEHVDTKFYDYLYPCSDLSNRQLLPMIGQVKAQTLEEFGGLMSHEGEEFTMVIEGRVEVRTEFYEPVVLEVGDSIYFDSTMGHAYLAASTDTPCRIVCVSTAPMNVALALRAAELEPATPPKRAVLAR